MEELSGEERRKFPRVKYHCFLKLQNLEDNEDVVLLTRIENICLGGIMVILKDSLEVGRQLRLSIELLASGENLCCEGVVSWSRQRSATEEKKPLFYDVGIEFVDLNGEGLGLVQNIVNR